MGGRGAASCDGWAEEAGWEYPAWAYGGGGGGGGGAQGMCRPTSAPVMGRCPAAAGGGAQAAGSAAAGADGPRQVYQPREEARSGRWRPQSASGGNDSPPKRQGVRARPQSASGVVARGGSRAGGAAGGAASQATLERELARLEAGEISASQLREQLQQQGLLKNGGGGAVHRTRQPAGMRPM